eukprot:4413665-Amphidinium_carterae.1
MPCGSKDWGSRRYVQARCQHAQGGLTKHHDPPCQTDNVQDWCQVFWTFFTFDGDGVLGGIGHGARAFGGG